MTQELLYTSAPKGLRVGSRGFCTVVSTSGMAKNLADRLEALSGYKHVYPPTDSLAAKNPVNYSCVRFPLGGNNLYVLSRVADAGLDYTQRTNKIAHHVALDARELGPAGPAWVMNQDEFFETKWQGTPHILPVGRSVPRGNLAVGVCERWAKATGDAGWAGTLAQTVLDGSRGEAYIIFRPGMDLLPLIMEAQSLLPPNRRWEATFSTYCKRLPPGTDCRWRCVLEGTPEAVAAQRSPLALVINLCKALGTAPAAPLVEAARTGVLPEQHPSEQVPDGLPPSSTAEPLEPSETSSHESVYELTPIDYDLTPNGPPPRDGKPIAYGSKPKRRKKIVVLVAALAAAVVLIGGLGTLGYMAVVSWQKMAFRLPSNPLDGRPNSDKASLTEGGAVRGNALVKKDDIEEAEVAKRKKEKAEVAKRKKEEAEVAKRKKEKVEVAKRKKEKAAKLAVPRFKRYFEFPSFRRVWPVLQTKTNKASPLGPEGEAVISGEVVLNILASPVAPKADNPLVKLDQQDQRWNVIVSEKDGSERWSNKTIAKFFCKGGKLYLEPLKKSQQGEGNIRYCVLQVKEPGQELALIALTKIPKDPQPWTLFRKNSDLEDGFGMGKRKGREKCQIEKHINSLPVEKGQELRLEYWLKNQEGEIVREKMIEHQFGIGLKSNKVPGQFGKNGCLELIGVVKTDVAADSNKYAHIALQLNWQPELLVHNKVIDEMKLTDWDKRLCTESSLNACITDVKGSITSVIVAISKECYRDEENQKREGKRLEIASADEIKSEADKSNEGQLKSNLLRLVNLKELQTTIEHVKDTVKNLEVHLRLSRAVQTVDGEKKGKKKYVDLYVVGNPPENKTP